jgi:hypothetical protein
MSAPDLADFLLARITEDENTARATESQKWDVVADSVEADDRDGELPNDLICEVDDWNRRTDGEPTRSRSRHIARWDPARVLAECEAKRRIVEAHNKRVDEDDSMAWIVASEVLLKTLALPYAAHPDYRAEWAL